MAIEKDKHEWAIFQGTVTNSIAQEIFQSYTEFDSLWDGSTTKENRKNMYNQKTSEDIANRCTSATPEQIAKINSWSQLYHERKRASETPEEAAKRRVQKQGETSLADLNKTIECSNGHERSRPTSRTMECDAEKHNATELKKDQHKDELSIFECSETSFISKKAFQSYTDIDSASIEFKTKEKLKNINDQKQKQADIRAKRRARYHQRRALETPEEAAIRQARKLLETPEQAEKRRTRHREYMRFKRSMETPEQINKKSAWYREYFQKEAPERAEKRRAHNREHTRLKRAMETPEEKAKRRARCRELYRQFRSRKNKKEGKGQNSKDTERVEITFAKLGSATTESSNGQEFSQPPSEIVESDTAKHIPKEIKKERFQDEYSIFECSEMSCITQEAFQNSTENQHSKRNERRKRMLRRVDEDSEEKFKRFDFIKMFLDAEVRRDKYLVYGEYIASRLRNCNREESEIKKAKELLQSILFYLNAGVYNCVKDE